MKIMVFDRNEAVKAQFRSAPDIIVTDASLDELEAGAVVSPANSFGFMDGNIDFAYSTLFGWGVQEQLQRQIEALPFGELLVGQALAIPTGNPRIPYLISAPTMRVPKQIQDLNDIMVACRAAVEVAKQMQVDSIAFPGMGTGCGMVDPRSAAKAMLCGIRNALSPMPRPATWREAQHRHFNLVSADTSKAGDRDEQG